LSAVFADTFYWIALTWSVDASHSAAVAFDASPERPLIITTEAILTFMSRNRAICALVSRSGIL
jgi:hypothetical protein